MEELDFMKALEREVAAMQAIVARADLEAPVPSCPEWAVRDLVVHTGQVHRHKTASVRDGWTSGPAPWPDGPDGEVIEWFDEGIHEMLAVFSAADLEAPTWTWCSHEHTAAWWVRRMAHETLIHGVDAALAVAEMPAVDEALAAEGVEELLVEMMVGAPQWAGLREGDRVIEFVTPDRSWIVRTATWSGTSPRGNVYKNESGFVFGDASTDPDTVITCSASALDLWLWGRGGLPEGAVTGDGSLADLVRSVAAQVTQ
jgi:uncharacterized protein (TIGR03083 family)